jgi:hypothetical protein
MSHGESEVLPRGALKILQAEDRYRYSIEPFLLAAFVSLPAGAKVVALGSGSGVTSLLMSQKDPVVLNRAAPVLRYQVIKSGIVLKDGRSRGELFETMVLQEYLDSSYMRNDH